MPHSKVSCGSAETSQKNKRKWLNKSHNNVDCPAIEKSKSNNFEVSSHPNQNGKHQTEQQTTNTGEDMSEGALIHCWWDCKLPRPSGNKCGKIKKLKINRSYCPSLPPWAYSQRTAHSTPDARSALSLLLCPQ